MINMRNIIFHNYLVLRDGKMGKCSIILSSDESCLWIKMTKYLMNPYLSSADLRNYVRHFKNFEEFYEICKKFWGSSVMGIISWFMHDSLVKMTMNWIFLLEHFIILFPQILLLTFCCFFFLKNFFAAHETHSSTIHFQPQILSMFISWYDSIS